MDFSVFDFHTIIGVKEDKKLKDAEHNNCKFNNDKIIYASF
jgi:hypothetical protein